MNLLYVLKSTYKVQYNANRIQTTISFIWIKELECQKPPFGVPIYPKPTLSRNVVQSLSQGKSASRHAERILERIFECSTRNTGISAFTTVKVYFTSLCAHALFRFPPGDRCRAIIFCRAFSRRSVRCKLQRFSESHHLPDLLDVR